MKIVEYKLHPSAIGNGRTSPNFITVGGGFLNPDNDTLIGLVPDPCSYYLPDTLVYLTIAEVKTRQLAINSKYPMSKDIDLNNEIVEMTDAEIETLVDTWHTTYNS